MSNRFKTALQIQEGASNRRLVSRKLHEMIVEVSDAGGDPDSDPAVFLVLHQLAWILVGRDIARSHEEWQAATKACEARQDEPSENIVQTPVQPWNDFNKADEVKSSPDSARDADLVIELYVEAYRDAVQVGNQVEMDWNLHQLRSLGVTVSNVDGGIKWVKS